MQHKQRTRTLGRTRRGRIALLRGLALSLIEKGSLTTTTAKAKELRPFIERLVTHAKEDTVTARRRVAATLGEPKAATIQTLFEEIAPRQKERNGGYTRIVKMGRDKSGRDTAVIAFVA